MSNLVEHARRELALLGEEETMVNMYIDMIERFSQEGHSGGSASVAIPTLNTLLQFQNLTELTDNPSEWQLVGESDMQENVYQSTRNPEAFSNDGGKTYHLLSEGAHDKNRKPLHETVSHIPIIEPEVSNE